VPAQYKVPAAAREYKREVPREREQEQGRQMRADG